MGKHSFLAVQVKHVTPQIVCLHKNEHCSEHFNTYIWGIYRIYMGYIYHILGYT